MPLVWESRDPVPVDQEQCIIKAGKHQGRAMACHSFIRIVNHMPPVCFVAGAILVWIDLSLCLAQAALGCLTFAMMKLANRIGAVEHFKGRVLFFTATGEDPCSPEKACGELPAAAHELRAVWLKAQR